MGHLKLNELLSPSSTSRSTSTFKNR